MAFYSHFQNMPTGYLLQASRVEYLAVMMGRLNDGESWSSERRTGQFSYTEIPKPFFLEE